MKSPTTQGHKSLETPDLANKNIVIQELQKNNASVQNLLRTDGFAQKKNATQGTMLGTTEASE